MLTRTWLLSAMAAAGMAAVAAGKAPRSASTPAAGLARATFAGGCFWCMEPPFEKVPGVVSVTAGYTGGEKKNPVRYYTYRAGCGRDKRLKDLWGEAPAH